MKLNNLEVFKFCECLLW